MAEVQLELYSGIHDHPRFVVARRTWPVDPIIGSYDGAPDGALEGPQLQELPSIIIHFATLLCRHGIELPKVEPELSDGYTILLNFKHAIT